MLDVDGFSGKANVLGQVMRVAYAEGELRITGITFADAREVLAALDLDRLRVVELPGPRPTAGREVFAERAAIASGGAHPAPPAVVRAAVQEAQARAVEPPPWEAPAAAPVEVPRVFPTALGIPEEVCRAADLRPVVRWLWAGSHRTPEAMAETMERLAATGHVPLLAVLLSTAPQQEVFRQVAEAMRAEGLPLDPVVAPPAPPPAPPPAVALAAPPAASPAAVASGSGSAREVPAGVRKAEHLRPVVDFVVEGLPAAERSRPSLDAVVRGVQALAVEVPLVARIEAAKLRGRVERTMTSMDLLPVQ